MQVLHMSGAGNDFAVLDARGKVLDFENLSRELCARLGADGFLALDTSAIADFKLHFYNSDGSRGEMCGNGARCICRYAYDMGIAGAAMTVETDAGLVYGWRLDKNRYKTKLNNPELTDLQRLPNVAYVELGNPGIPHSVTECPDLEWEDKERLLPVVLPLRNATAFPKGVNVNLYRMINENTAKLLTYERGVEDFTLACGTGSASVAVTLWLQGKLPGDRLTVLNPGGTLEITIEEQNGEITALYLEGPTAVVDSIEA